MLGAIAMLTIALVSSCCVKGRVEMNGTEWQLLGVSKSFRVLPPPANSPSREQVDVKTYFQIHRISSPLVLSDGNFSRIFRRVSTRIFQGLSHVFLRSHVSSRISFSAPFSLFLRIHQCSSIVHKSTIHALCTQGFFCNSPCCCLQLFQQVQACHVVFQTKSNT